MGAAFRCKAPPNTIASVASSLLLLGWSLLINYGAGALRLMSGQVARHPLCPGSSLLHSQPGAIPCAKANVDRSDASAPAIINVLMRPLFHCVAVIW